jgi:molybdenum cofactor guanylyltransferase
MGRPKGLLPAPDTAEPLIERSIRIGLDAGLVPMLVGDATPYDGLARGIERIADDPRGEGPLSGLLALVRRGDPWVVALACDMPFVDREVLVALAGHPSERSVVPRHDDGTYEPFLARYAFALAPAIEAALESGTRSIQRFLADADVTALPIDAALGRALRDWDSPADVDR